MTLESFAFASVALGAPADLPHTRRCWHVLVLGFFSIASAACLLLSETTGSTKAQPILPTCMTQKAHCWDSVPRLVLSRRCKRIHDQSALLSTHQHA